MSKSKRPVPEQVRIRLNLRSSSAASRHANEHYVATRPGHGKRSQEKRRAIAEWR